MDFVFAFFMFAAGLILGYNLLVCFFDDRSRDLLKTVLTPDYLTQTKESVPKRKTKEGSLNLEKVTLLLTDLKQKYDMIANADTQVQAQVEVGLLRESIKNLEEKNRELNQRLRDLE